MVSKLSHRRLKEDILRGWYVPLVVLRLLQQTIINPKMMNTASVPIALPMIPAMYPFLVVAFSTITEPEELRERSGIVIREENEGR